MFKQRLLTAMILVPLVLMAIYYANLWTLALIVLLVVLICTWEWLPLIPVQHVVNKLLLLLVVPMLVVLNLYAMPIFLILGLIVWGLILPAVLLYPAHQKLWGSRWVVGGASCVLLPVFASAMVALFQQEQGRDLIVYLLCLIWATDIGAYLAGKQWGQHKLIPMVSPGKTLEGALGGIGLAVLVAIGGCFYFNPYSAPIWFVIAIATILMSMLGDLFVSMLKRRSQIKDTGTIFPGHGGMLDRLDSLIAACPLFYCGLHYLSPGL